MTIANHQPYSVEHVQLPEQIYWTVSVGADTFVLARGADRQVRVQTLFRLAGKGHDRRRGNSLLHQHLPDGFHVETVEGGETRFQGKW